MSGKVDIGAGARLWLLSLLSRGSEAELSALPVKADPADLAELQAAGYIEARRMPPVPAVKARPAVEYQPAVAEVPAVRARRAVPEVPYRAAVAAVPAIKAVAAVKAKAAVPAKYTAKGKLRTAGKPAVEAVDAVAGTPAVKASPEIRFRAAQPAVAARRRIPGRPEVLAVPALAGRPAVPARTLVTATAQAREAFVRLLGEEFVGPGSSSEAKVLAKILSQIRPVLENVGVGLDEILAAGSKVVTDEPSQPTPPERTGGSLTRGVLLSVVERSRDAAGQLRLSSLRESLASFDRKAVDAMLVSMHEGRGGIVLMREDDQRSLTDADRVAALDYKGDLKHLVMCS